MMHFQVSKVLLKIEEEMRLCFSLRCHASRAQNIKHIIMDEYSIFML